ncbi:MAG: FxLYD domain-containing protein [Alphaproteobacteria bacterium]|nr:FxLYD domain-containing protein [Alphaproteobacteria bacterium]
MKIVCDFCKTEYNLERAPNTPVKCAVCGHVWTPRVRMSQKIMIKFIAAICAFIAACVFSFVVLVNFSGGNKNQPLVTKIDEKNIHTVLDENGNKRIFVSGDITNTTNDIYGLPNIIIISYDAMGNVLSRQTFMPPATLLESKTTVTFNHMLSVDPTNVKRLSVELKGTK